MTDFITTINNGSTGSAFSNWWTNTVPATVPSGDRYIAELGTENLNERPHFQTKTINGDIILRSVAGEGHDGTRGTGITIVPTSASGSNLLRFTSLVGTGRIIIEDLQIEDFATNTNSVRMFDPGSDLGPDMTFIMQRCLLTNVNSASTRMLNLSQAYSFHLISNRLWYDSGAGDLSRAVSGFSSGAADRDWIVQGNVVICDNAQRGIDLGRTNATAGDLLDCQGNLVLSGGQCYAVSSNGTGIVFAQNVSEDATGQVTGASIANDIVSVNNPDAKTGSLLLLVWTNKPTTFGAEIDIRGFNRSVVAGTAEWDSGSMQFSTAAAPPGTASGNITRPVTRSVVSNLLRSVAPDIIFT